MHTLQLRRSFAPVALAATLLATFLVLFAWPQSAAAHDALVDSTPAAGSEVDTLPEELTLTFSAALIDGEGATAIEVLDANGNSVTDGEPTVDGAMVIQPLVDEAIAGEYHVVWKVISSDGHPTSEEFDFIVTTSTLAETAEPTAEPTAAPSAESTMNPTDDATTTPSDEVTAAPDTVDSNSATGWIWAGVAAGILVIAGIIAWLVARARRKPADSDSDTSTER